MCYFGGGGGVVIGWCKELCIVEYRVKVRSNKNFSSNCTPKLYGLKDEVRSSCSCLCLCVAGIREVILLLRYGIVMNCIDIHCGWLDALGD